MIKLYDVIQNARLSPNQVYLLYCIKNSFEPLFINVHLELRGLKLLGYIDKNNIVTGQGELLLNELGNLFKGDKKAETVSTDHIDMYLSMWPSMKLPSGKYARCDRKNLETNFKWFFANYKYTWEIILQATAMYINEYQLKRYMYMRTSQYFIKKQEADKSITSELANYCALIVDGTDSTGPKVFDEKVF
jgi:hypothetical protein